MVKVTYVTDEYDVQGAVGQFFSMCDEAGVTALSVAFEVVK